MIIGLSCRKTAILPKFHHSFFLRVLEQPVFYMSRSPFLNSYIPSRFIL